ncbi:hypothetical protein PIB30_112973, partial [Stylosanthes scabra]|nr:hypothetical protein [Stylosanthes scabra]
KEILNRSWGVHQIFGAVAGVTPNESPDLAKVMGDIASVLKDIREGQQNILNA